MIVVLLNNSNVGVELCLPISQFRCTSVALFTSQGKSKEAERIQMQALRVYEQALGPAHPTVATACCVLARCMRDQVTQDRRRRDSHG